MRKEATIAFGTAGSAITVVAVAGVFESIGFSPEAVRFLIGAMPSGLGLGFAIDTILNGRSWSADSPKVHSSNNRISFGIFNRSK